MISEIVPSALAGERLDRLVSLVCDCSRSKAAELVKSGGVKLDGVVQLTRSVRVEPGWALEIDDHSLTAPAPLVAEPDVAVTVEVVYEDEHLAVVNKPAGLIVHPGAGNPAGTMVQGLLARFPEMVDVGDPSRPGIVHRLDRGTSGLLVVARTEDAYDELVLALSQREVTREYEAVSWGVTENDRGVIDAPIGRSTRQRTRMAVIDSGKEARTHYEVLQRRHDRPSMTWLACRLDTGRTHQIRVHLQAIGHSVVGDEVYGGVRTSLDFVHNTVDGGRPALHAKRLAFAHPISGEQIECVAELPDDMHQLIAQHFEI